ncbi:cytochrome c oxidase subunit 2A [Paenibacillus hamazuiensis]|uniref:cytochrome c oxidase subunit 2A n=1 Tax=Paenibacillus hamazuiensis TaxID=2936508 RepID=UPI003B846AFE
MAKPHHAKMTKDELGSVRTMQTEHKESSLKGTFASVMLLGFFLVLTWAGAFALFLHRN